MSFINVTFALSCQNSFYVENEVKWCYVLSHSYQVNNCWAEEIRDYMWSMLEIYKCDAGWWVVDLRDAPLESGQYLVSIWENAFSWTNVTNVIMPSSIVNIWNWVFCSAKREWGPACWNEIIEAWEECDDWDSDFGNWYTRCSINCTVMDLPNCGNWHEDPLETCGNCEEDLACWKSGKWTKNDESFEFKGLAWGYDNSGFVELSFPGGMNPGFNPTLLYNACAKLPEYTVTFKTERGEVLWEVVTQYQYLDENNIPFLSDEEWLVGGWYLWDQLFVLNSQISEDITLVYKYGTGWIEKDEDRWLIRVFFGDQEIIVKDRNQWAEKSINEVEMGWSDEMDAVWYYYFWWNNVWLDIKQAFDGNGWVDMTKFPEWFDHGYLWIDWWNDWTVWSKDMPCNPASWEYLPSPDDWKNLMQLWWKLNWYEVLYNPIWWWYAFQGGWNTTKWAYNINNIPEKFASDFLLWLIPSLYVTNLWVDFDNYFFYQSSMKVWNIWYITQDWLVLLNYLDNIDNINELNSVAMPVRCFILPQFEVSFDVDGWSEVESQLIFSWNRAVEVEAQKENAEFIWWYTADWNKFDFSTSITSNIVLYAKWKEKASDNYSGWWGAGSSSSNVDKNGEEKHNSAEDKAGSSTEENIGANQDNIVDNKGWIEKGESESSTRVTYVPDKTLPEMEQAYNFSSTYGITSKSSVEAAQMNSPLTRIQMAKMLSNYAMNVLWRQPDVSKWTIKFNDVTNKMDKEYDNGVTISYQLWIMWQNMPNNNFRPNDEVTRAEFVAAFSRMIYWTSDWEYKSTSKYYTHHMEKLKKEWIVTKINPNMKEKRWYVMMMLMRSVK